MKEVPQFDGPSLRQRAITRLENRVDYKLYRMKRRTGTAAAGLVIGALGFLAHPSYGPLASQQYENDGHYADAIDALEQIEPQNPEVENNIRELQILRDSNDSKMLEFNQKRAAVAGYSILVGAGVLLVGGTWQVGDIILERKRKKMELFKKEIDASENSEPSVLQNMPRDVFEAYKKPEIR